jgi:hypothetical protein
MTGMQYFDGILVALAALAGIAIALSVVIFMAARVAKPGAAPQGGTRRDLPQLPQSDTDDARVLVLR